jgi:Ca-activated chloride channel family protein
MIKRVAVCIATFFSLPAAGDDNLIAHRLFEQQRYAEAAEVFTDPAWKGVALYRSSQWWRAAEAFIRADDARALYNLGNTYVRMGFYALALEAYQGSLAIQPDLEDAQFNAELIKQLLQLQEEQRGQSALQRRGEEIDRVDSSGDEEPGGNSPERDDKGGDKKREDGSDRQGDTDDQQPVPDAIAAGDSQQAGSDQTPQQQSDNTGGATRGTETDPGEQQHASTGAEGGDTNTEAKAASLRLKLEAVQANQQWLNQINHDARRFLRNRITLEAARRRQAGDAPPEGGSLW